MLTLLTSVNIHLINFYFRDNFVYYIQRSAHILDTLSSPSMKTLQIYVYCYPTTYQHVPIQKLKHLKYRQMSLKVFLYIQDRFLCYFPSCHKCFHVEFFFKSVTTKISLQCRKQMLTVRRHLRAVSRIFQRSSVMSLPAT